LVRRNLSTAIAEHTNVRIKSASVFTLLIGANLAAWAWALAAFREHPVLLGTALLAYSLGARHAVDADHIAAIDNVTRKLMQQGDRPVGVGLFFSLGHSTVVVLASLAIALGAGELQRFAGWRELGGVIGTSLSAGFLFAIALANLLALRPIYRAFRRLRHGGSLDAAALEGFLLEGMLGRLFRPLLALIRASWQMYPLGFLFALGFDTATEVGVLGISAAEASRGLPIWSILVFPVLFTAAMSLADTADGVLMLGAYGWAFTKPLRKLYYNLSITLVSVLAAVIVGGVELLGVIAQRFSLEGAFWSLIEQLNDNFGSLGLLIIGVFALSWGIAAAIYRLKRFGEVEAMRG
jgi:nickel/cobalt transporter (NiCoT) family protein